MSARKTAFVPGEYYHLYNRGNSKQKIFHDDEDRIRFEELLFLANGDRPFNSYNSKKYAGISNHERGDSIVAIGAYCMMPNHFHLLVTQTEGGSISKFMQKLTTAYVMYYNEKYDHSGGLFEGKFKAIHLPDDRYLKYVFSYIHLNPLKLIDSKWKERGLYDSVKAIRYLNDYRFSSYNHYRGVNELPLKILHASAFPEYFPDAASFEKELRSWINFYL